MNPTAAMLLAGALLVGCGPVDRAIACCTTKPRATGGFRQQGRPGSIGRRVEPGCARSLPFCRDGSVDGRGSVGAIRSADSGSGVAPGGRPARAGRRPEHRLVAAGRAGLCGGGPSGRCAVATGPAVIGVRRGAGRGGIRACYAMPAGRHTCGRRDGRARGRADRRTTRPVFPTGIRLPRHRPGRRRAGGGIPAVGLVVNVR